MSLLTVREMAGLVSRTPSEEQATFERIRHWTRERLLVPAGGQHPGTGFKRLYAPSAVQKCRVLNELTDFDVTMRQLQLVSDYMDSTALEKFKSAPGEDLFLVVEKIRQKAVEAADGPPLDRSETSQDVIDASWRAAIQNIKLENEVQDKLEFSLWRRTDHHQRPTVHKDTVALLMVKL
jgi:hypothetical protein